MTETPVPPSNRPVTPHKGPDLRKLKGEAFEKEANKMVREQAANPTEVKTFEETGPVGETPKKGDYSYAGPKVELNPKAMKKK
jgi:hypothetical protein